MIFFFLGGGVGGWGSGPHVPPLVPRMSVYDKSVLNVSFIAIHETKILANISSHTLLHVVPRILILFLEQLFFNQMMSIGSFGRRDIYKEKVHYSILCAMILKQKKSSARMENGIGNDNINISKL